MDRPAKQTSPAVTPTAAVVGAQHSPLIDALRITQDNMAALSRLQEQTVPAIIIGKHRSRLQEGQCRVECAE